MKLFEVIAYIFQAPHVDWRGKLQHIFVGVQHQQWTIVT